MSILELIELPEALAFSAVCKSWCSAVTAAGIPRYCTPWLMSWAHLVEERESQVKTRKSDSAVTCKFRHLLDVDKAYDVTFPKGCFVTCCGSSHGWLVLVNELCNLLLYNPFTSDMIPLPPITDFTFVEAVYDDKQGKLDGYRVFNRGPLYDANYLATFFYTKAVLSCRPSKGGNYILATIHNDSNWVSFARAGEDRWQVVSTLDMNQGDRYADCAYHNGRLYTVTYYGIVERWTLDEANGPTKERCGGDWGGVRVYDLQARTFEIIFPLHVSERLINPPPTEIWIIPNME
ncbi:hypothetical protein QYE76_000657 [Lolium multiflorum]|uniref:KIB1-4 beta-propeller domain-containing protein n=1 Tax=Lolium multiflorum TaxID=4521 RepID=A0AAD8VWL2_LOLMU|nr:hypothetical protein QYE76_000657 [Lolium multiflorum]